MLPAIGETRPWADPEVVSIGRLPMRPTTTAFATVADAREGDPRRSPWRRSLNGRWRFRLHEHPDRVTRASISGDTTGRAWRSLVVPGNWTLQGVGDLPQYTNVAMPFPGPPPRLPERNPTGVYRRRFRVMRRWSGRQIVLHVGGAESVHALYVNGRFAGYGTDSRLASEYDVTDLVRPGDNELAVVVVRWSAQSYVEDQDQWWMAGLHREVYVEARGAVHVHALTCDTSLLTAGPDSAPRGLLVVRAELEGVVAPSAGWTVRTWVETLRGRTVSEPVASVVPDRFSTPYVFTGFVGRAEHIVEPVEPWSAERPTRYRVVAELADPDGRVVEVHAATIGFRNVEVRDGDLLVNGERIWVFGVNRHDHHPTRGKAVTADDMRDDLLAMRRHNITALRCAHYPNDPVLLDLCDELGMYVIDEADVESHAFNTSLCHDPRFRTTWLARCARLVERDRNHPSVIAWSLGNESGHGAHHRAAAAWIRAADPSRPLHYEGAVFHDGWADGGRETTDLVCPMYPEIHEIEAYGRSGGDRPLVMCEYSHAMGNSNGSLADYWDTITSTPRLQGGFIWEWKDHGLWAELPDGRRGFAYGGQFGESPHDGNFVADGLMSSDLVPHPAMQEVAWVYRPVTVERSVDGRGLRVTNRRRFVGLDDLVATWELAVGDETVETGRWELVEVPPAGSVTVSLPTGVPERPGARFTVRWRQRGETPWAPAGHLVAWDQVELTSPAPAPDRTESHGGEPAGRADRAPVHGTPDMLTSDPELCVIRAPVDNDGFKLMPDLARRLGVGGGALARWQDAGLYERDPAGLVEHRHEVHGHADGSVVHEHEVTVPPDLDDLPRIGVAFELRTGVDRLRWFGRGPLENYPDRNRGAMLGVWEAGVDRPPYLVPQEFGLRTDCRWFEFIDPVSGERIRLDASSPAALHVSATRFTVDDLYRSAHETDLRPRRGLIVHVDVVHRGLGTASCGPDVLGRYRIGPGTYRFAYRLSRV